MSGKSQNLPLGTCSHPTKLCLAALLTLLVTGCASPGPPHPPSLNLPKPVTDLAADRIGNQVFLRWTAPARNTDNLPAKGALTAVICRAEILAKGQTSTPSSTPPATSPIPASRPKSGPHKPHPAPPAIGCAPILRLNITSGPNSATDQLPSSLAADPVALLDYRVEILNTAGHSAGPSNPAYAAAGSAPAPIEDLQATTISTGTMLEWRPSVLTPSSTVELNRLNNSLSVSHPNSTGKAQKPPSPLQSAGQESPETHLRVPPGTKEQETNDRAGTLDLTARFGPTYRYTAQRVRTVELNGHTLEIRSLDSAPVTLTLRDTFPPATPTGLIAIPGQTATQTSIDLSWQSNSEPDLAGYNVYRRAVSDAAISDSNLATTPARLNPTPTPAPAFRDLSAIPGQRYAYTITAIDTSGNESPPTPEVHETLSQP